MAGRDRISNTPTMTTSPPPTRYHRWLGWYAPAMRRAVIVGSIGLTVMVVLVWFLPWGLAVVAAQVATGEDETRGSAAVLLLGASVASLLGVVLTLDLAGRQAGPPRVLLIG